MECGICGGLLVPLGTLGSREWYRCRNCGLEQMECKVKTKAERQKEYVFKEIAHMVDLFLYYARKEDDNLPLGAIQKLVDGGHLSVGEMAIQFEQNLRHRLKKCG